MELKRSEYLNLVDAYQKHLDNMECPKCGKGRVSIDLNFEKTSFQVHCNFCLSGKWNSFSDFFQEYKRYKKIVPIKDTLREYEKNSLKSAMRKSISRIILKSEDIISRADYEKSIIENPQNLLSLYNNFERIKNKIKLCSKVEQLVLREIINLCEVSGHITDLIIKSSQKTTKFEFIRYVSSTSIISSISEKTKVSSLRNVMKRLMNKGLIAFCEDENYIDTHIEIVKNKELILKFFEPQKIENEIRYKVFSKYDFKCSNCCETNIPLRIAYLRKDKNTSNLNYMIPLCQVCFEGLTENEIMVDGTIAIFCEKENLKSWRFITKYFPKLGIKSYKVIYLLALRYGDDNVIKSIAIGLHAIDEGKKFANINFFYKYIKTILDKAEQSGNDIKLPRDINQKYSVDEWLKLI